MSWYAPGYTINQKQKRYITFLEKVFNVKTPTGEWIPYNMTPYQQEFHSRSLNILREQANDILFVKARGISFTFSSLIELIVTAALFKDQIIPIMSQRGEAAVETIDVAKEIIQNCNLAELKEQVTFKSQEIEFHSSGSTIKAFPSSSAADAVRGKRLIRGMIDEFAFQENDKELWAAAGDTMQGDFGQWLIGSTPNGRNNMYFELHQQIQINDLGFDLFMLPVFDPEKFDPKKSILEQNLEPIAPWISLKKLEQKRARDWRIFMQENMCDFLDESQALISFNSIQRRIRRNLENHKDKWYKDSGFIYKTDNPIYIGVDVAESRDFCAISAFEEVITSDGQIYYIQKWIDYFKGKELPELETYLHDLIEVYPTLNRMRIDKTGLGSYLPAYLQKTHGSKIEGINFASSVFTNEGREKVQVTKAMATNLKRMIEEGRVFLLPDPMQQKHLGAINYSFKASRSNEEGHADIFWANALALLQSKYSIEKSKLGMIRQHEQTITNDNPMTLQNRIKYYKKQQKRR